MTDLMPVLPQQKVINHAVQKGAMRHIANGSIFEHSNLQIHYTNKKEKSWH